MKNPINYIHRPTGEVATEKVYGQSGLNLFYGSSFGIKITSTIFSKKWFSKLLGSFEDTGFSRFKIKEFIGKFNINMKEYEPGPYRTFNDFFIRKFLPESRVFSENTLKIPAPCEGRYFVIPSIKKSNSFVVKNISINLEELIQDPELASKFDGGSLVIIRLCPVDYHRFHFPISGEIKQFKKISGPLHSVNPLALSKKPDILMSNERHLTLIHSTETTPANLYLGHYLQIEVGALMVGKIYQKHPQPNTLVKRGEEKGYFLFGGSSVLLLFEPNKIQFDPDLLENTQKGLETWVPLGNPIASLKTV